MNKSVLVGTQICQWTLLEETDKRTKAGSIIFKCYNEQTKKVEYKSIAYLAQYKKRRSQKTSPGRYRHFIRLPLEDFIIFAENMKVLCPEIVQHIKDRKLENINDVNAMFEAAEAFGLKQRAKVLTKYINNGRLAKNKEVVETIKKYKDFKKQVKKLQQDNK